MVVSLDSLQRSYNAWHAGVAITRDFQLIARPPAPGYCEIFSLSLHHRRHDIAALLLLYLCASYSSSARLAIHLSSFVSFCVYSASRNEIQAIVWPAIETRITPRECFRKSERHAISFIILCLCTHTIRANLPNSFTRLSLIDLRFVGSDDVSIFSLTARSSETNERAAAGI